jgi:hypothetical protein
MSSRLGHELAGNIIVVSMQPIPGEPSSPFAASASHPTHLFKLPDNEPQPTERPGTTSRPPITPANSQHLTSVSPFFTDQQLGEPLTVRGSDNSSGSSTRGTAAPLLTAVQSSGFYQPAALPMSRTPNRSTSSGNVDWSGEIPRSVSRVLGADIFPLPSSSLSDSEQAAAMQAAVQAALGAGSKGPSNRSPVVPQGSGSPPSRRLGLAKVGAEEPSSPFAPAAQSAAARLALQQQGSGALPPLSPQRLSHEAQRQGSAQYGHLQPQTSASMHHQVESVEDTNALLGSN